MTRKEAIAAGEKHYNGRPCKNCKETLKFVSSYGCVSCTTSRTNNRSPAIYDRYIKSKKGQKWIRGFRRTNTYRSTQRRYHNKKYNENPDFYRNQRMLNQYGISLNEYNQLRESQNYSCAICNTHESETTHGLCIDHCHNTHQVRKLLCSCCNVAIGMAKESTYNLQKMIEYIEEHKN